MLGLLLSLFVLCATSVIASSATLIPDLTGSNITVVAPGQSAYASASTAFNLRFTFDPAAVTFPKTTQDVSNILKIANSLNYQAVARSGGHSYIASGLGGKDGSVVVDMSNFTQISVDPTSFIATIGPGNRLGDIALSLNDAGRALPHGRCPYIGMGGHSGYGGWGFPSRQWGLTLDAIQALEVVLANGTIANVSATSYPDLFFALRGSSGSFGIVTSIQVQTFPVPQSATVFEYGWDLNVADATNLVEQFQKFVQTDIPQTWAAEIDLRRGSASGFVALGLTGAWYGPANQLAGVIAPLLNALPTPSNATLTPGTYINSVLYLGGQGTLNTTNTPEARNTFYAKSLMTPEAAPMCTAAINAFMTYLGSAGFTADTEWFSQIELYGGPNSAINSVPFHATAFAHRSSLFTIQFYTSAKGGVPPFPDDGFTLLDGMVSSILDNEPTDWDYGAYPNYIDDRLANGHRLYYGAHYSTLKSLKAQYDPNDTFKFPTSIAE